MKLRNVWLFVAALLIIDQVLKIWIKTTMAIGDSIPVFGSWFQLYFVENNGAAFGMQLSMGSGFDWGKALLSSFRICMIAAIIYYIAKLVRESAPKGIIIPIAMILAGAIGNMIDSIFYGLIFSESTTSTIAHFGGSYAPMMMGKVVDMLYFPLFRWESAPGFLQLLLDSRGYFFGAIFNIADSYITVAVAYIILFQSKYFK
ncbi:MAG: lipoprotein signal peptidase [Rikenellaceae bacterium]